MNFDKLCLCTLIAIAAICTAGATVSSCAENERAGKCEARGCQWKRPETWSTITCVCAVKP